MHIISATSSAALCSLKILSGNSTGALLTVTVNAERILEIWSPWEIVNVNL
jgi:hypothetical protein